ncbi:MAG: Ig-like domain-containing protein, partial [Planctomycetota bacterium]
VAGVRNGAGRIINDADEVGGWPELKCADPPEDTDADGMPDEWEKRHGLDAADPADRNADADGDGYTNLEEYLSGVGKSW